MRFLKPLSAVLIAAGASAATPSGALAITSSSTKEITLTKPQGVTIKCTQSVDNLAGGRANLEVSCHFKNTTGVAKRFVMCMMLDLRDKAGGDVPGLTRKHFELVEVTTPAGAKQLECREVNGKKGDSTSYHFGCHLITLAPGAEAASVWKGAAPYQKPQGRTIGAIDFQVATRTRSTSALLPGPCSTRSHATR